MSYLFLAAIGPVQDFIKQARRSRDLFYGSWLLSELSKSAARAIAEREGLTSLIFPAPETLYTLAPGSTLTVANKILAQITMSPDEMGGLVHNAVLQHLRLLWQQTKARIRTPFCEAEADAQIDDLLEFYWVAVPQTQNYRNDRKLAESILAGRKNTRGFQPASWASSALKSSLDGQRESVIPDRYFATKQDDLNTRSIKKQMLFTCFSGGPAERLSGVDLLKRKGQLQGDREFPSTSHIAALPFIMGLETLAGQGKPIKRLIDEYREKLKRLDVAEENLSSSFASPTLGDFDGAIFYPARFAADMVKGKSDNDKTDGDKALDAHREFMKSIEYTGELNPYYGILLADGDGMGRVIDAQTQIADHQELSRDLSKFAASVPEIVSKHRGGLIYAGGDDVMAFVPLNKILSCSDELANTFRQALKGYQDEDGNTPTLSVGIAVGHFLDPMDELLDLARGAERRAKKVKGKNALAITASKRSGSDRTIAGKWGEIDTRLGEFVGFALEDAIPAGFAYELLQLENDLGETAQPKSKPETGPMEESKLSDPAKAEALRIIHRKRSEAGTRELAKQLIEKLNTQLVKYKSLQEFSNELIIAQMIADGMREAGETVAQSFANTSTANQ